jgi:uncharacterized membrane protein YqhA
LTDTTVGVNLRVLTKDEGDSQVKDYQSLTHTRWDCKYRVMFIPKKRKKRIFGVLRRHLAARGKLRFNARRFSIGVNMNFLEKLFEGTLWNSRYVIIAAVVGSLLAGFAIFYMATVDVVFLFKHALHYASSDLTDETRKVLHDQTVSHIVEVVDGYLLATVMLIFSLGLYELFISDINQAHGSKASSKILVINSLDDLKTRLAKVILMILIVTLFEEALNTKIETPLDLVYLGASIALIALALYFGHASEAGSHENGAPEKDGQQKH